jgi:hypothetical protein
MHTVSGRQNETPVNAHSLWKALANSGEQTRSLEERRMLWKTEIVSDARNFTLQRSV